MKNIVIGIALAVGSLGATSAMAQELVTNGNFSKTSSTGSQKATTPSQLGFNGYTVDNWSNVKSNGYNFLFNPTLAGSAAYTSTGQYGDVSLYTSANGGSATAPASLVSPTGGNFLAADPAYQASGITQTINNLVAGQLYTLSFWWAGAQQTGFSGATTDGWTGTFGSSSFATPVISTPDHGFSAWRQFTTTLRAGASQQALTFLAVGGPSGGQPPFVLLDGVSLVAAVPEPATWAMMIAGFGAVGFAMRRRRGKVTTTVAYA